jgi:protein ImuA
MAALLLFALSRRTGGDRRPVLVTAPRSWFAEHGRPYSPGAAGVPLILAPTTTVAEALWTLEQALRSGAVALALGAVDGASLAQTRRLDFAAKQGEAVGLVLPRRLDGLSAARRRWRISTCGSATDLDDPRAPGPARLLAELVRGRGERPGAWMLEQDDETYRLRLADRLAGDGLAAISHAGAPSGLAA